MKTMRDWIDAVTPPSETVMREASAMLDKKAKPVGSLGVLESIAVRLAGIAGSVNPQTASCSVIVCAADHGIVEEGVSVTPMEVTALQAVNMTRGMTGVGAIAGALGASVRVLDVGIATPYTCDDVVNCRVREGSRNFLKEDALTAEEVERAMLAGAEAVSKYRYEITDITSKITQGTVPCVMPVLGIGEMGIGNTTCASAVLAALTGRAAKDVTGYGGGLTDAMFAHKIEVIESSLRRRTIDPDDVTDVLCAVGGLDLAAMCGAYIGAAACRHPAVIDGFPSAVAALLAVRSCPACKGYLFPSHASTEPGFQIVMEELGFRPYLDLEMRLGEGSGCPFTFQLMRAACAVLNDMAGFEEAGIDTAYLARLRKVPEGC